MPRTPEGRCCTRRRRGGHVVRCAKTCLKGDTLSRPGRGAYEVPQWCLKTLSKDRAKVHWSACSRGMWLFFFG
eukprot:gene21357-biopygen16179